MNLFSYRSTVLRILSRSTADPFPRLDPLNPSFFCPGQGQPEPLELVYCDLIQQATHFVPILGSFFVVVSTSHSLSGKVSNYYHVGRNFSATVSPSHLLARRACAALLQRPEPTSSSFCGLQSLLSSFKAAAQYKFELQQHELLVLCFFLSRPCQCPFTIDFRNLPISHRLSHIYHARLPLSTMLTSTPRISVSNMLNRLHGQPESYDKKYVPHSPRETTKSTQLDTLSNSYGVGPSIASDGHSVREPMESSEKPTAQRARSLSRSF